MAFLSGNKIMLCKSVAVHVCVHACVMHACVLALACVQACMFACMYHIMYENVYVQLSTHPKLTYTFHLLFKQVAETALISMTSHTTHMNTWLMTGEVTEVSPPQATNNSLKVPQFTCLILGSFHKTLNLVLTMTCQLVCANVLFSLGN